MSERSGEQRGGEEVGDRAHVRRLQGGKFLGRAWLLQLGSAPGCALSGTTSSISGAAERAKRMMLVKEGVSTHRDSVSLIACVNNV